MRYRLVIFDFDGTLADSFALVVGHMGKVIERFQLRTIEEGDLEKMRGLGAREVIEYLKLPYWRVPVAAAYMRRLMAADVSRVRLFPGSAELLRRLSESGAKVAIVSSNAEGNIRMILGPENVRWIDCLECGSSLFGKAAKFRKVLKRTGVPPSETLAIGDEIRDLAAAGEVGIDFGAVAWGYTKIEALRAASPTFLFQHPGEVPKRITAPTADRSSLTSDKRGPVRR